MQLLGYYAVIKDLFFSFSDTNTSTETSTSAPFPELSAVSSESPFSMPLKFYCFLFIL